MIGRLDGFSTDEIEKLKTYEQSNKDRVTLMKWFDRGPVEARSLERSQAL